MSSVSTTLQLFPTLLLSKPLNHSTHDKSSYLEMRYWELWNLPPTSEVATILRHLFFVHNALLILIGIIVSDCILLLHGLHIVFFFQTFVGFAFFLHLHDQSRPFLSSFSGCRHMQNRSKDYFKWYMSFIQALLGHLRVLAAVALYSGCDCELKPLQMSLLHLSDKSLLMLLSFFLEPGGSRDLVSKLLNNHVLLSL